MSEAGESRPTAWYQVAGVGTIGWTITLRAEKRDSAARLQRKNMKRNCWKLFICFAVVMLFVASLQSAPNPPPFYFQGSLQENNLPANGTYDFQIQVYDAVSNGNPVGTVVPCNAEPVANGLFTLSISLPGSSFSGQSRWLELSVRPTGSGSPFTTLHPRQQIGSSPYSSFAFKAAAADSVAWSNIVDVPPQAITTYEAGQGLAEFRPIFNPPVARFSIAPGGVNASMLASNSVTADAIANGAVALSKLDSSDAPPGGMIAYSGGKASWKDPVVIAGSLPVWRLGGNKGIDPQSNFIGTTDPMPFELRANGQTALLFEPTPDGAVNITAGAGNHVDFAATGSAIAGGRQNSIAGDSPYSFIGGGRACATPCNAYAAIVGGLQNFIGSNSHGAFIGGGASNRMEMNSSYAVIAGGSLNQIQCDLYGAIGGGLRNKTGMDAHYPTISGGRDNQIGPNAVGACIPGGVENTANGTGSFAAGQRAGALHQGTFAWNDNTAGPFNSTGSNQFLVHAAGGIGLNVPDPTPGGLSVASSGTALELRSGSIKVTGAGMNTTGPAFIHRATKNGNISGNYSVIDHPLCNNDPNAILIVTQNWNPGGAAGTYNPSPVGVFYTGSHWAIFNQDTAAMPDNAAFNVLVIKP